MSTDIGSRNTRMFRKAQDMFAKGHTLDQVRVACNEMNRAFDVQLPARELGSIITGAWQKELHRYAQA